jgi:septal ring factor EnvC (AmiA/AmiB activator)
MLIALITILILGSSSTGLLDYISDTQDQIKIVMQKDERRQEALSTVKKMKKRTKARNKQVNKARKEMSKTLARDDATITDIDAVWDRYFVALAAHQEEMLDLRFELRDTLTRDEWQQVFSEDRSN